MKHVFILNPKAGSGTHLCEARAAIESLAGDIEIYETKAPKDATRYIRQWCESHTEDVRFYACGGDGTIREVAEGILGFPQASMSCFPIGSGNDFVKYYGGRERFTDLSALCAAAALPVDMITLGDEYSVNVCNFGFDAAVASTMNSVRRLPLIGGKRAYTTGILRALITARRNHCDIYADGEKLTGKAFLLCTVANGAYVGGAFRCAPHAKNDDGKMEVCVMRPMSLFTFLRLMGPYSRGEHLDDPRFAKYMTYRRAARVEVSAKKPFPVSLDGEIIRTAHFTCTVLPGALRFAVPHAADETNAAGAAEPAPVAVP